MNIQIRINNVGEHHNIDGQKIKIIPNFNNTDIKEIMEINYIEEHNKSNFDGDTWVGKTLIKQKCIRMDRIFECRDVELNEDGFIKFEFKNEYLNLKKSFTEKCINNFIEVSFLDIKMSLG